MRWLVVAAFFVGAVSAEAQLVRRTIGTIDMKTAKVTVYARNDGVVEIDAVHGVTGRTLRMVSNPERMRIFARAVDSVARVPVHAPSSDEVRFDPVSAGDDDNGLQYVRLVHAKVAEHVFEIRDGSDTVPAGVGATVQRQFTGYLREAARVAEQLGTGRPR